ncbi:hypothetical protein K432DRAFT_459835, partial [Lepidopterella palustris CBS 459.81]
EYKSQERSVQFVKRIFHDFGHLWRHVLRNRYNDLAFRRLTRAIIQLATIDLNLVETNISRPGWKGHFVTLHDLLHWEPFPPHIISVGHCRIVLSQHLSNAISILREDCAERMEPLTLSPAPSNPTGPYVTCTQPFPLLNALATPSEDVVKLLLSATQPDPPTTPIYNLPIELQDEILYHVSIGAVEGAGMGCMLGLSLPCLWAIGAEKIVAGDVLFRAEDSPTEQRIRFGDFFSALANKCQSPGEEDKCACCR